MVFSLCDCLVSIFLAAIGAVSYVWFWSRRWRDLITFKAIRCIVLGIFAGFAYYLMRLQWNAPDHFITMMVGWFASDFLSAIAKKVKQILGIGNDSLEVK